MNELFEHQKKAVELARQHDSFALFMETGTGKTRVAIELLKQRRLPSLIVCPLSIIESVWIEELQKWFPEAYTRNLWLSKKSGKNFDCQIGVINFESLSKLPDDFLQSRKFLIIDESSKIKSPTAKVTKFLVGNPSGSSCGWGNSIQHRLLLSGTPAPNSPLEYWSQMKLVNPNLLGDNFYKFRAIHFYAYGYGGYQWAIRKESKNKIIDLISSQSYAVQKEDCLDLPDQIFESRKYEMLPEQKSIYINLKKENIAFIKTDAVLAQNELVKIMKLRQITAGFALINGQEKFISNGKIDLLKETIEEIGNHQVIIWCQFHSEIERIKSILGDDAGLLYGDVSQADKEIAIKDFQMGRKKYLVAHPKSGGHGLTFVNCSYNIYFSLDYSFESEKQSQDRTHRIGQKNKVTYFYLLAKNSIDEIIYRALRRKERLSAILLGRLKSEL